MKIYISAVLLLSCLVAYAELIPADAEWEKGPYITSFDGRLFRFSGRPASYYSLISTDDYQITMKFNHNGTHIEGVGLEHEEHRVIININAHNSLEVFMDGLQLKMRPSETQQQHVLDDLDGSAVFSLNWDLQFPELGNTAEITTAFMRVVVWLSPESFSAEGGARRAPYLNFDAQLLQPPVSGVIEGIVGEGYQRLVSGEKEEDDLQFHALAADYEMASYFKAMRPLAFAGGLGGQTAQGGDDDEGRPTRSLLRVAARRRSSRPSFPMHGGVAHHGVRRYAKAVDRERKARKLADKDGIGGLVAHAGSFKLDRPERGAQGSRTHRHSSRQSRFS